MTSGNIGVVVCVGCLTAIISGITEVVAAMTGHAGSLRRRQCAVIGRI